MIQRCWVMSTYSALRLPGTIPLCTLCKRPASCHAADPPLECPQRLFCAMMGMTLPTVRLMPVKTSFQICVSFASCKQELISMQAGTQPEETTHVCSRTRSMNGEYTKVIGGETPYRKSTTERSYARICTLKHTISCQGIPLLTSRLFLNVSHARCEVVIIHDGTTFLANFELLAKILLLVSQPLCNLLTAEC